MRRSEQLGPGRRRDAAPPGSASGAICGHRAGTLLAQGNVIAVDEVNSAPRIAALCRIGCGWRGHAGGAGGAEAGDCQRSGAPVAGSMAAVWHCKPWRHYAGGHGDAALTYWRRLGWLRQPAACVSLSTRVHPWRHYWPAAERRGVPSAYTRAPVMACASSPVQPRAAGQGLSQASLVDPLSERELEILAPSRRG